MEMEIDNTSHEMSVVSAVSAGPETSTTSLMPVDVSAFETGEGDVLVVPVAMRDGTPLTLLPSHAKSAWVAVGYRKAESRVAAKEKALAAFNASFPAAPATEALSCMYGTAHVAVIILDCPLDGCVVAATRSELKGHRASAGELGAVWASSAAIDASCHAHEIHLAALVRLARLVRPTRDTAGVLRLGTSEAAHLERNAVAAGRAADRKPDDTSGSDATSLLEARLL